MELLAPNGEQSNLTVEQYELVRTPEFKAWFGDWENDPKNSSKVIDENGEPLVVYHGTPIAGFYEFDPSKKGKDSGLREYGNFFSDNRKIAGIYMSSSHVPSDVKERVNTEIVRLESQQSKVRNNREYDMLTDMITQLKYGKVYEVFLNLRNVVEFDGEGEAMNAWYKLKVDVGYDIKSNKDAIEFLYKGHGIDREGRPPSITTSHPEAYFEAKDGVIARNIIELSSVPKYKWDIDEVIGDAFLVFDSQNIKLADGSNTTFDGNNPDIRMEKGGGVTVNTDEVNEIRSFPLGKLIAYDWKIKQVAEEIQRGELSYSKNEPALVSYVPELKKYLILDGHHRILEQKHEGKKRILARISFYVPKTYNLSSEAISVSDTRFKYGGVMAKGGAITDSENFKEWFGDLDSVYNKINSLIKKGEIDEHDYSSATAYTDDGANPLFDNVSKVVKRRSPLVVYHGTDTDDEFYEFQDNQAHFFSEMKEKSETYGKRIIPVYLDIKKPFIWDAGCVEYNETYGLINSFEIGLLEVKKTNKPYTINRSWNEWTIPADCDGIIIMNIVDTMDTPIEFEEEAEESPEYRKWLDEWCSDTFIVANSSQIKLADGSNTEFDGNNPDIRMEKGGDITNKEDDLVALHNINAHQIISADKLGGLVTPSIAILKSGEAYTDFGRITLIADKKMINPENYGVRVYSGDVYSPTVPAKLWYVDKKALEKEVAKIYSKAHDYEQNIKSDRTVFSQIDRTIGDYSDFYKNLNRNGYEDVMKGYYDDLKLVYLVDKDIRIKVPTKFETYYFMNTEFSLTSEQKKRFKPIMDEFSKEQRKGDISEETNDKVFGIILEIKEQVKKDTLSKYELETEEDKSFYKLLSDDFDKSFEKQIGTRNSSHHRIVDSINNSIYGKKVTDLDKFEKNINKKFTKAVKADYKEWLSEFLGQFFQGSYFEKGKDKLPYELDYLVEATSSKIRGQEKNMTFGANQAKSYSSKQFKDIKAIKSKSGNLVSKEDMNKIDEDNKEGFHALRNRLKYEWSDSWGALDDLGKSLADYYKGRSARSALSKNDFIDITDSQIEEFEEYAKKLKNSPVDYFEAKMSRAVKLSEFAYAVVPHDEDKQAVSILRKDGVKVKKYKTTEERTEIVNEIIQKNKKLRFEDGGIISNPNFEKWFGDSKVVDENGEPLIVYHQTQADFKVFDINRSYTHSFWFTSDLGTIEAGETGATNHPNKPVKVMEVYLSIQNMAGWDEYDRYGVGELISRGYDGVKLDDVYVVFEPEQIKSATDNAGDFNPNNPDITMAKGGLIKSKWFSGELSFLNW